MADRDVIGELISWGRLGCPIEDFTADRVAVDSPGLWSAAMDAYGSWEAALAAALLAATVESSDENRGSRPTVDQGERPERVVGADAQDPLYVRTGDGALCTVPLPEIACHRRPTLSLMDPEGRGIAGGVHVGGDDSIAIVTTGGGLVAFDRRQLPTWGGGPMDVSRWFDGLDDDEGLHAPVPRRVFRRAERIYFASEGGMIKATSASEYASRLSTERSVGVVIREGDRLFRWFGATNKGAVMMSTTAGKAIIFSGRDVRLQGRKAGGVKGVGLDEGALVCGCFPTDGVEWIVLATAMGVFKRMPISEFRPQGRGGGGLQTCRLAAGDTVAGVVPVDLAGDVVCGTNAGRVARFPAYEAAAFGRSARGDRLLELEPEERLVWLAGVPAGEIAD